MRLHAFHADDEKVKVYIKCRHIFLLNYCEYGQMICHFFFFFFTVFRINRFKINDNDEQDRRYSRQGKPTLLVFFF